MADFTVGSRNYRSSQLDPFVQLKIVKRMAPLFPYMNGIMESFGAAKANAEESGKDTKTAMLSAAGPIADALQKLPEQDFDFIIKTCLSVTMTQEENIFTPIMKNNILMYPGIGALGLLMITINVLVDNIDSFCAALGESGIRLPGA